MQPSRSRAMIEEVFSPADSYGTLASIGTILACRAIEDGEVFAALMSVRHMLNRSVDHDSLELFRRIGTPQLEVNNAASSYESTTFEAAVFLMAKTLIGRPSASAKIKERLSQALTALTLRADVEQFFETHQNFAGELLVETALRSLHNPSFTSLLNQSAKELGSYTSAMGNCGAKLQMMVNSNPNDDVPTGGGGSVVICEGSAAECAVPVVVTIVIVLCVLFC